MTDWGPMATKADKLRRISRESRWVEICHARYTNACAAYDAAVRERANSTVIMAW